MYDSIIVGGGISGLTTAWKLHRKGLNIKVLEGNREIGGNIRTHREGNFSIERGPHSFMGSSEHVWRLVEELDAESLTRPASSESKNRYIYRNNKLVALPMSFKSFVLTSALSLTGKMRLMVEPFIRNGAKRDDTAWEFFLRRFGKEAATYIMTPFVSGIYAGNINQLGARAAFTKFWDFEHDGGSMIKGAFSYMKKKRERLKEEGATIRKGLFSLENGLGTLTQYVADKIKSSIQTGVTVEEIKRDGDGFLIVEGGQEWRSRTVVLASPPPQAASILQNLISPAADLLNEIPMAPVSVIHWSIPDPENSFPDGFGFLMPRVNNLRVLGTLFPSKLFDDRCPEGHQLFASFYGGMMDPEATKLSDDELVKVMIDEHKAIFKHSLGNVNIVKVLKYSQAIPQLLPDHLEKVNAIQQQLSQTPGLFLAGNYLTGVGIEHAVESGFTASLSCIRFLNEMKESAQ